MARGIGLPVLLGGQVIEDPGDLFFEMVADQVYGQGIKPCEKFAVRVVFVQIEPDAHENVLGQVSGVGFQTGHAQGQVVDRPLKL